MTFWKHIKADMGSAAYRIAGSQAMLGTKHLVLKALQAHGINNQRLQQVSQFLDSEVGSALLSTVAGIGVSLGQGNKTGNFAHELRVNGLTILGNLLVERTIGDVLPIVRNILHTAKYQDPKIRVANFAESTNVTDFSESLMLASEDTQPITKRKQLKLPQTGGK